MKRSNDSKVFANEAKFEEAYERFLGNLPEAGKVIRDRHAIMESSFRDYLDSFERWVFRHAYEHGYETAMLMARDMDKEGTVERNIRNIPCPSRMNRYQVSSYFGRGIYENEHDAILAVYMLAPYHNMEILMEEVKVYLDMYGYYDAYPIVVKKCEGMGNIQERSTNRTT